MTDESVSPAGCCLVAIIASVLSLAAGILLTALIIAHSH